MRLTVSAFPRGLKLKSHSKRRLVTYLNTLFTVDIQYSQILNWSRSRFRNAEKDSKLDRSNYLKIRTVFVFSRVTSIIFTIFPCGLRSLLDVSGKCDTIHRRAKLPRVRLGAKKLCKKLTLQFDQKEWRQRMAYAVVLHSLLRSSGLDLVRPSTKSCFGHN